ncbi:MAG: biotin--[acetyl-CoA-carboxylase] ligase [Nocardioides sp.]
MTDAPAPRPPLDRDRLRAAASTWRVEVVDTAPSTNAVVANRARDAAAHGLVVVAEHQTAGRGRLDRTWETPARAALTFSVLLRPTRPAADWPWLPLLAGHAVATALHELEVPAVLKWPNDVLVATGPAEEEAKVAGLLLERIDTPEGAAAVLGIGVNVTSTRAELPVETATSVLLASGSAPDRTDLMLALLAGLTREYDAWQRGADESLRSSYASACVTLGRDVRVDLPGGEVLTGRARGIDEGGRLLVGETSVGAGDVVHVRASSAPGSDDQ